MNESTCHFSDGSLHVCPELDQFLPRLSRNPVGFSLKEVKVGGTLRAVGVNYSPKGSHAKYEIKYCPFCGEKLKEGNRTEDQ